MLQFITDAPCEAEHQHWPLGVEIVRMSQSRIASGPSIVMKGRSGISQTLSLKSSPTQLRSPVSVTALYMNMLLLLIGCILQDLLEDNLFTFLCARLLGLSLMLLPWQSRADRKFRQAMNLGHSCFLFSRSSSWFFVTGRRDLGTPELGSSCDPCVLKYHVQ